MRCVGFLRTYLYIGFRTMFPAPYKVRVSYLPLEKEDDGRVVPARPGEERTMPKLGEPLPDGERWVTEVDRWAEKNSVEKKNSSFICVYWKVFSVKKITAEKRFIKHSLFLVLSCNLNPYSISGTTLCTP